MLGLQFPLGLKHQLKLCEVSAFAFWGSGFGVEDWGVVTITITVAISNTLTISNTITITITIAIRGLGIEG